MLAKVGLGLDAVVKMDCLFKDINDLNLLPEIIKKSFNGKYPVRKAFTSEFIREGIGFQIDAIAYTLLRNWERTIRMELMRRLLGNSYFRRP